VGIPRQLLVATALMGCGRFDFANRSDGSVAVADASDANHPTDATDAMIDAATPVSPLLWFKLDETSGKVADSGTSTENYNDKFSQLGVAGVVGNAARLGNMNDGISFLDAPGINGFTALTIEGWMKYDTIGATAYSTLLKKDGSYILRTCDISSCGPSRVISFVVWDQSTVQGGVNGNINSVVGTWYHLAGVYDGVAATAKIYLDGVLLASGPVPMGGALTASTNELDIGRGELAGENLTGELDEVKMWPVARTDAEVCGDAGKTWTGSACM
jgi:hypothetical protein